MGLYKIKSGRSKIHGRGVKATHVIDQGEVLIDHPRDRYREGVGAHGYNHSCDPNVVLARQYTKRKQSPNIMVVAIRRIERGEELTVCYSFYSRKTPNGTFVDGQRCNCPVCK